MSPIGCLLSVALTTGAPEAVEVFRAGESGYHTFRIPAIVATDSGELLAFCEGRVDGAGDAGNIDIVLKRSTDRGRTWGELVVVANAGAGAIGNPTPVFVPETREVVLLAVRQPAGTTESEIRRGERGSRDPYILRSANGGRTWTEPRALPACDRPSWGWYATGPCHAIQLRHGEHAGRLVVPANHSIEGGAYGAHLLLSDDLGNTWRIGAIDETHVRGDFINSNETTVAELSDGTLHVSTRDQGGTSFATRAGTWSTDGGASFVHPFRAEPELAGPVCQGSLLTLSDGRLVFSGPADPTARENLELRVSDNDGHTWRSLARVYAGEAAYSDLVELRPGTLGCLFEADSYGRIVFDVVSLEEPERPRPNVLLIVSDDQGWNDIGYHDPQLRTPNLDRLAREGVELERHYVQPQCTPTRVALLTGRYPSRFAEHCTQASNEQAFPVGTQTLARVLRDAGYATGMSGKWHLGSRPEWGPNHHGFEESHGSLAGAVGMYDHRYRLGSPFADTWHRDLEPLMQEGHVTDLCADEAIAFVERHAHESWFLYLPLHAVHTPLVESAPRWGEANAHIDDADRRLFASALTHMDDAVGRVVASLERTGQLSDTLIVFTSDNGAQVDHAGGAYPPPDPALRNFSSNAPLRGRKTEVFEGGIRVPAFVYWKGRLQPRRCTQAVHAVDWLPTLAGLLGVRAEGPLDGRDVWPQISGDARELDRTIYTTWGRGAREAIQHGPFKTLRNGRNQAWRTFHLGDDPFEQSDGEAFDPARLMAARAHERELDREPR